MEPIEFIKAAKELSERYGGGCCYENQVILEIVKDVAKNWIFGYSWAFSSRIKFHSDVGYSYARGYTYKLKKVLEELGIECERCYDDGDDFIILEPKFKE